MLLSARPLADVASVNIYTVVNKLELNAGDPASLYFQLIDASIDRFAGGRRYVPSSGSTLQVVLMNIDVDKAYTKTASQPFSATDPSIWSISVAATDSLRGTVNFQLILTEGAVVRRGLVSAALLVHPVAP